MALHGLRDQDRLEGLSNFSVSKARILIVLEAYGLRDHAEQTLATPQMQISYGSIRKLLGMPSG